MMQLISISNYISIYIGLIN